MRTLLLSKALRTLLFGASVLIAAVTAACPLAEADTPVETSPAYQTAATGNYEVMSRPEASIVTAAAPIIIDFTIKNIGQQDVYYDRETDEDLFEFVVKDQRGNDVPLTSYGKRRRTPTPTIRGPHGAIDHDWHGSGLKPGESKKFRMLVNQYYDMSIPGAYTITPRFIARCTAFPSHPIPSVIVLCKPMKIQVDYFNARP